MVLAQRTAVHLYGDMMVWYHMFVIFVMYCMLPVPVKGRRRQTTDNHPRSLKRLLLLAKFQSSRGNAAPTFEPEGAKLLNIGS